MKQTVLALLVLLFTCSTEAGIKESVKLDVPIVAQGKSLCGPATIEMLFRYWGVDEYDQYDIAKAILQQFPNSKRYVKSGILKTYPIDWDRYPGTGTINMREFLKRFGRTHNFMLKHEPPSEEQKTAQREQLFNEVKEHVSYGVPVIVHQYWKLPKSRGHYRIVTGYDESKKVVYLNDAHGGKRIKQSYDVFLKLWNVDRKWLHYNGIVFNSDRKQLDIRF